MDRSQRSEIALSPSQPPISQKHSVHEEFCRPVGDAERGVPPPYGLRSLDAAANIRIHCPDILTPHHVVQCADRCLSVPFISGAIQKFCPYDRKLAIAGKAAVSGRRSAVDRDLPRQETVGAEMPARYVGTALCCADVAVIVQQLSRFEQA